MGAFIQNEIFDDLGYNYLGITHYPAAPYHCQLEFKTEYFARIAV